MPANTSRGFPYPLPTEPVAEGAQAIRNLAESLDARIAQHIATQTLSAPAGSITFSAIPQTFTHLYCVMLLRSDSPTQSQEAQLRFNGVSATEYDYQLLNVSGATVTASNISLQQQGTFGIAPGASETAAYFAALTLLLPDYRGGNAKTWMSESSRIGPNVAYLRTAGGIWRNGAAISSVALYSFPNLVAGSKASLYGLP